jgi:FlaA1/EpsC-like NDP-sugar epimerase
VLATARLLELAAERGVERLVYPSSDKAVNPPSLYGATKRISEVLVQRAARTRGVRYLVGRYVNIVGTRGSVIETFAEQIAAGQSLTVTDRSMGRYWITMPEATWLVAQAAAVGAPESVLMLDARDEVPTVEVARRLRALLEPGAGEPAFRFTGPRPGERLHEELLSANESFVPGPSPGLLEVAHASRAEQLAAVPELLADLTALVEQAEPARFKRAVMEAARDLQ